MKDISIVQGDAGSYNLKFTAGGEPLDITGATVTMTVKRSLGSEIVIQKAVTSHADPTTGVANITLTEEDTNIDLGAYYYDIEIMSSSIPTKTVLRGKLTIEWQVGND